MASYTIEFRPSAEKELRKLPSSSIARIAQMVDRLADDPIPQGSIKLTGSEDVYRVRVGDYRIIYVLDRQAMRLIIQRIRHRKDIYRRF